MLIETPSINDTVVEIDWFAAGDKVQVCPRSKVRFEVHKDRAIQILQLATTAESQLNLLMQRLGEWLNLHTDKVREGYLTLRDARFAFLVVTRDPGLDDDLEDSLSDLDFEIANDPDLEALKLNALILPPASKQSLSSFFDRRFLVKYGGHGT